MWSSTSLRQQPVRRGGLCLFLSGAAVGLLSLSPAQAAEIKLAWERAGGTGVAGYAISYGEASDRMDQTWNVGNTSSQTITGLDAGKTYYFMVRAYNYDKSQYSAPSNKVQKRVAATPVADFSATRTSGPAPLAVTFEDKSTGDITWTNWAFSDGSSAQGKAVAKSFSVPGTYTVSLSAGGPGGENKTTKFQLITVHAKYDPVAPLPSERPPEQESFRSTTTAETIMPVAAYEFDEVNGRIVTDHSGNGNDGLLKSARRSRRGYFGKAVALAGKNSIVAIPNNTALRLTHSMTLSAWIRIRSRADGALPVLTKQGTPNSRSADNPAYFLNANSDYAVPSAGFRRDKNRREAFGWERSLQSRDLRKRWVHLAATYDGGAIRTYVNGSLVGSQYEAGPIDMTNGDLVIGGDGSGAHFQGLIDSVRIYDQALTEAEIQAAMNQPLTSK